MASKLDLCAIRDTAAAFGVKRADGTELLYFPSTILGTNEISPLTMAAAYAAVSNKGVYCSPVSIDKVILRRDGSELAVPQTLCSQAVPEDVALAMVQSLKPVITGGTGAASNPGGPVPLAGKTGTTDNRIHTWMIGFSSEVATATWVGNVSGQVRQGGKRVNGNEVTVIRHVVWKQIMRAVNEKYGGTNWPAPDPKYVSAPAITIPAVSGLEAESAKVQLLSASLSGGVMVEQVASPFPAGTVAYTRPAAGEAVPRGSLVRIYISAGGRLTVPDVRGLTVEQAYAKLQLAGLFGTLPQPSQTSLLNKCDSTLPKDSVFSTQPGPGEAVLPASAVIVIPNKCG
jgi:membrane peptidoglycan carboxypeptidase